jgi:hypothetical protein
MTKKEINMTEKKRLENEKDKKLLEALYEGKQIISVKTGIIYSCVELIGIPIDPVSESSTRIKIHGQLAKEFEIFKAPGKISNDMFRELQDKVSELEGAVLSKKNVIEKLEATIKMYEDAEVGVLARIPNEEGCCADEPEADKPETDKPDTDKTKKHTSYHRTPIGEYAVDADGDKINSDGSKRKKSKRLTRKDTVLMERDIILDPDLTLEYFSEKYGYSYSTIRTVLKGNHKLSSSEFKVGE